MKIICAPDSFKESLSAKAAAEAMARGVRKALPGAVVDICPISDGGEGFVDAMVAAMNGRYEHVRVPGPLPDMTVNARTGLIHQAAERMQWTAVLDMASAAGLELIPPELRNPLRTSTFGFGKLVQACYYCTRLLIGIGGSATNDGGCGMAQALGMGFYDQSGRRITEPLTGGMLHTIARIDPNVDGLQARVRNITVACDVTNPLTGPNGAAYVYGPQKGASPRDVEQLDQGLQHLARIVREQLDIDEVDTPGAGAAGGLGYGLMVFLCAKLMPGIDLVLDTLRFNARLTGADLVLTGEGKLDGQSLSGKACLGVAQRGKVNGVSTIALVGAVGDDVERTCDAGLDAYHVIGEGLTVKESMARAAELLEAAAERVCRERFGAT